MGRCHTDRSGYWGPWTNAENTFSNEYFRLLLEERWSPKATHRGKPWTGPDQYEGNERDFYRISHFHSLPLSNVCYSDFCQTRRATL